MYISFRKIKILNENIFYEVDNESYSVLDDCIRYGDYTTLLWILDNFQFCNFRNKNSIFQSALLNSDSRIMRFLCEYVKSNNLLHIKHSLVNILNINKKQSFKKLKYLTDFFIESNNKDSLENLIVFTISNKQTTSKKGKSHNTIY